MRKALEHMGRYLLWSHLSQRRRSGGLCCYSCCKCLARGRSFQVSCDGIHTPLLPQMVVQFRKQYPQVQGFKQLSSGMAGHADVEGSPIHTFKTSSRSRVAPKMLLWRFGQSARGLLRGCKCNRGLLWPPASAAGCTAPPSGSGFERGFNCSRGRSMLTGATAILPSPEQPYSSDVTNPASTRLVSKNV